MTLDTLYPDFIQRSPNETGGVSLKGFDPKPHCEADPAILRAKTSASAASIFEPQPSDGFDIISTTEKKEGEFDMNWAAAHFPRTKFVKRRKLISYLNHWGWNKALVEKATSLAFSGDINPYLIIQECERAQLSATLIREMLDQNFTYQQFTLFVDLLCEERLELPDQFESSGVENRSQWQLDFFHTIYGNSL